MWGALLCAICGLALIPALALAWFGLLWLPGLDGLDWLSAAFLVAGPLLLGLGAVWGWRSARTGERRCLIGGAVFTLLARQAGGYSAKVEFRGLDGSSLVTLIEPDCYIGWTGR